MKFCKRNLTIEIHALIDMNRGLKLVYICGYFISVNVNDETKLTVVAIVFRVRVDIFRLNDFVFGVTSKLICD